MLGFCGGQGCFLVFMLCPIVPSYLAPYAVLSSKYIQLYNVHVVSEDSIILVRSAFPRCLCAALQWICLFVEYLLSLIFLLSSICYRAGSSIALIRECQENSRVSAWESAHETGTLSTPIPSCLRYFNYISDIKEECRNWMFGTTVYSGNRHSKIV